MAAKRFKLAALWGMAEAAFATDPDTDGSDYKHLKAMSDMVFEPSMDVIERDGLVNDLVRQAHVMGAKGGSLTFKLELKGSGTEAADNTPSVAGEADAVLGTLFGTTTRQTGSIVAAGSTTSALTVTAADGAGFSKYGMVVVFVNATYGYQARFITSIAGDVLTLDRALSALPANGSAVYGTTKFSRANSAHASMAFVGKRGEATSIEYTLLGCKVDSAKISGISARGTAMLEMTYSVTDWAVTTKASLPATVLTGITAIKAPVIKGACFAVAGVEELAYGLDFDFAHKFEFQDATCALGTAQPDSVNAGLELVGAGPMGTIKSYHKTQHLTDFFAGTEVSIAFSAVNQSDPGASWGIYIPKAQYTGHGFEDHSGMIGESIPFKVNDNSTDPEYTLCVG